MTALNGRRRHLSLRKPYYILLPLRIEKTFHELKTIITMYESFSEKSIGSKEVKAVGEDFISKYKLCVSEALITL